MMEHMYEDQGDTLAYSTGLPVGPSDQGLQEGRPVDFQF